MNNEILNNDYKDWILFDGVNRENFVFDISKHSDFILSLDDINKARFKLALKEMLMNNTLSEYKKDKIYLLTSLGREVLDAGTFSSFNPRINSDLNINEKFSKNLELNKRATKITIGVAIGTMIILIIQTYISTKTSTIRIEKELPINKELQKELRGINNTLYLLRPILADSLNKERQKQTKK
ncbi:hypothetical protein [Flavobacterium sp. ZS1P14]|uniref:hypothetical protein n=1 Tax=Flavobacterium sp. ZS1P14 TaxID=3401729 RepID=UPI003AB08D40